jgi:asparagine synthase (glutamine-hydrolysing)
LSYFSNKYICIFVFIYKNNNFPHNTRHLLEQTVKALKHRGPDADGIWFNNKHKIGVAQTRLAIQGVGVAADQPMHSVCGNFTVVFNGQLYNHHSLKKQLTNIGAHYRTDSDTETLLHAYQHWGTGCLSLLDGMFAFAIFDKIKNKLFAARDRFGIKPFYFSTQNEIFSFASTLNPLWQLPWIKQKLTQEGQESFLTYMSTPAPLTAFEQVYKLPAGFYAEIESNLSPRFYRWYNLLENLNKTSSQKISQRQCIEKATYLLEKRSKKEFSPARVMAAPFFLED